MGVVCQANYYRKLLYISKIYTSAASFFAITGLVMMLGGAFGIYCVVKKSYRALITFCVIFAVMIVLHIAMAVFAFQNRGKVKSCFSSDYIYMIARSLL